MKIMYLMIKEREIIWVWFTHSNLLFKMILKKEISSKGYFEGKNIVLIFYYQRILVKIKN